MYVKMLNNIIIKGFVFIALVSGFTIFGCTLSKSKTPVSAWEKIKVGDDGPSERIGSVQFWDGSNLFMLWGYEVNDKIDQCKEIWRFNPSEKKWAEVIPKTDKFPYLYRPSITWSGTRLLIFGGETKNDTKSRQMYEFLPSRKIFREVDLGKNVPSGKAGPVTIDNRFIYLITYVTEWETNIWNYKKEALWKFNLKHDEWSGVDQKNNIPKSVRRNSPDFRFSDLLGVKGDKLYYLVSNKKLLTFDFYSRTWKQHNITGEIPEERKSITGAWTGRYFIMFGGYQGPLGGTDFWQSYYNDLWLFDTKTKKWTKIEIEGITPPPLKSEGVWTGKFFYIVYGHNLEDQSHHKSIWRIDLSNYINSNKK